MLGIEAFRSTEAIPVTLSGFGSMWSALDDWCSPKTKHFLHGSDEMHDEDEEEESVTIQSTHAENQQHTQRKAALLEHLAQWYVVG